MRKKACVALGFWLVAGAMVVIDGHAFAQEQPLEQNNGDAQTPQNEAQSTVGDVKEDVKAVDRTLAQATTDEAQPPAAPPAAEAQVAAAQPAPVAGVEELLITGSRIKRKSIATAAPVTVVNKEDLLATGRVSIAEILQQLPSQANGLNTQFNNGGNGASRINLRSVGAERTLVLLNGRRYVAGGDGANVTVDLNSIPVSIIERVEVLLDGGSSIYGSDAVAGVVNIITRDDFDGVEANAFSSISQRGDGRVYQIDLTGGISSDKGNLMFSALFLDAQPIFASERNFSEFGLGFDWAGYEDAGFPDDDSQFVQVQGSSFTPQGTIVPILNQPGNAAWQATGCGGDVLCFNDPETGWRPYVSPDDTYNFQPDNYVLTPSRRLSLYTQGSYDISDYITVFMEGNITNRASEQLLAPNPLGPGVFEGITVSAQNRFNPFGRDFGDVRRRLLEGGNRGFTQDSNTFRVVFGARGKIPDIGPIHDWTWDAYGNFGRTETINTIEGRLNTARLELALGPDALCTGNCVPLDLFSGAGNITQEMLDYVSFTGVDRGYSEQNIGAANISGPLFELVEGQPVALAFGYQFRKELGADVPNPLRVAGDASGNRRGITEGGFEVHAGYGELSLPLLADVPGFKSLELTASGRFVDFNSFGSNFAGKVGLRWQPVDFAAIRATYSTAFRAPSLFELFSGQTDSFETASDPCSAVANVGSLDNPIVAANCATDDLAGGVPDPNTQIRTRQGGNPDLDPETAQIITAGIVLEDSLIRGLTMAVDYYNINIEDAIQAIGTTTILSSCYASENRQFCDLIERNDAGIITNIFDTDNNVGGFSAQGIDFNIRYSTRNTPYGRFGVGLLGTVLLELTQTQATGFEQDLKGNFDQEGSNPDFRLNGFVRWAYEWANAGINMRYLPGFTECQGACSTPSATAPRSRDVDAWYYMDIFAGANVTTPLGDTSIQVGINNLTDVEPPLIVSAAQPRIDPGTYDFIGRQFYMRLSQRF